MQLSVIILNYNVRFFLEQCVDSVLKAIRELDAEVIVVDNNSSDDSCAMIRERFPQVRLIAHPENAGFPKGNNIGVAAARGEYILILNPDTVVPEDVFVKTITFFEQQENPGIVGVRLIDGRGNFLPESKRGVPTPWVAFTKITGLSKVSPKLFGKYYASHLSEFESGRTDILVGAFMLMKTSLYRELGGFDEACFMYSDDIDLSYMVLKAGKTNYYFAGTTVIHYKGESTVKDREYIRRFSEAMDFFYRKHFRKAVVFDLMLKVGAYAFSKAKSVQPVSGPKVEKYWLLSDDKDFAVRLSDELGKEVVLACTPDDITAPAMMDSEIIFDVAFLSYSQLIQLMKRFRSRSITFKIAHKSRGFIIGSDSSQGRGTVINIADRREGLPII